VKLLLAECYLGI
jgi:anaphase-promoting complex subunit 3